MSVRQSRHACLVYEGSPLEQLPVITPLLAERLQAGYRCLYLGEAAGLELVSGALWERGVAVAEECAKGSLVFTTDRAHLDHGGFEPAALIAGLEKQVDQALDEGYKGLWATGDMAWELGNDVPRDVLVDYETRLDALIARKPLGGVCQYRRGSMPPPLIETALGTHSSVYLARDLHADVSKRLERDNAELEKRVKERTAELEFFANAVAHDLKAPLRSIEGFSAIIERRHGREMPPEARDLFSHVRKGATQMGELIDALLALSRLGTQELHVADVDLSALAELALERLRSAEPGRRVTTKVQPGLQARGDSRLLGTAIENLLTNAWKFTSKSFDARVEVAAAARDGRPAFVVRDNGTGFSADQASRLFKPFQRLHSRGEFPGNGLGLTSVKRIVERHGGEVWAEGAPGLGSAFYFTLNAR